MSAPHAFVMSSALSFRAFVADGGRDPRVDPRPGDVVGIRAVGRVREMHVERVGRGRVGGRTVAIDGPCRVEGCFEVEAVKWCEGNATVSVFVVAGEGA